MNKELIELYYQLEDIGIFDEDVSELGLMTTQGGPITNITRDNTDEIGYTLWIRVGDGVEVDASQYLGDEEKIELLKEILAWC